jgi:hypothetical protein
MNTQSPNAAQKRWADGLKQLGQVARNAKQAEAIDVLHAACQEMAQWQLQSNELLAALRLTVTALGERCLTDVLNPCWDARPNDVPGHHWGGGNACAVCTARAVIAKVEGRGCP